MNSKTTYSHFNPFNMKQLITLSSIALLLLTSCGDGKKVSDAALNDKKAELEKLKSQKDQLDNSISKLEKEILKLDTSGAASQKTKLVAIQPIAIGEFSHYIELQGRVDAENVSYITPRGNPGQIKEIHVQQGQLVRKGQLLLKLDDAILQQSLAASKQAQGITRTQLAYAKNIYQRQKNLWDQNIGTEVQVITARNNVETLEAQLKSSDESVKVAQEQLKTAFVYSDVSGVADVVSVKVGEIFSGSNLGGGVIKIVNTSQLKVTGNIPENYSTSVGRGSLVKIEMPDINKNFNSSISFIGASIDNINRGFVVDAKLPSDPAIKPNQLALMKIQDYHTAQAIAIPINTIQNDEKGKFVMVASNEKGKLVARKRTINIGILSDDMIEIKTGLKEGESLITEGYSGLYDGQPLTTK